jgi:hypothetical protein
MLRGRRSCDTIGLFVGHDRPTQLTTSLPISTYQNYHNNGLTLQISTPMCFATQSIGFVAGSGYRNGWLADFEAGRMDQYYGGSGSFARRLKDAGLSKSIIRLGWEMCGTGFPWQIASDFNYSNFNDPNNFARWKAVYRRIVNLIKNESQDFLIEFCCLDEPRVQSKADRKVFVYYPSPDEFYPGADYADIISDDNYAKSGLRNDSAVVKTFFASSLHGNPRGPHAWYLYARSKGKLYNNPEWGVRGADNSWWVYWMWHYFRNEWKDYCVSNWYFNQLDSELLTNGSANPAYPLAYAQYRATFGADDGVY